MRSHRLVVVTAFLATSLSTAGEPGVLFEVQFIDGGSIPVRIHAEKFDLSTKYGDLSIPIPSVKRAEIATRLSPDAADRLSSAVERLGHADFRTRRWAEAELRDFHVRAYPLLLKAAKLPDPETARRAESLVQALRRHVPPERLNIRELDVIHTEEGQLYGKLAIDSVRINTSQFGELVLKLSDAREIRQLNSSRNAAVTHLPAPGNMTEYQGRFGAEVNYVVTGPRSGLTVAVPPQRAVAPVPVAPEVAVPSASSIWGTDVYTLDSHLPTAAVHAGVVRPGETATVRVRVVISPPTFTGSSRNGIVSNGYDFHPPGAFEFIRP